MAKSKQRQIQMAVKSVTEDGTFEGCLSPYNNVDEGNDLVEPGAFTKTIQENEGKLIALWQHGVKDPIGELLLEDRSDGLWVKGRLLLEIPEAKKAYLLMKAKIVRGLSIGYDVIKAQMIDGVRHLKEIRLWEGSVVTFPMNPLALITDVKSRENKGDFNEELTERQLWDGWYQMNSALWNALACIPWSAMSREEMIAAADTVIQQFHDAFTEYFPQYLDLLAEAYGMDTKAWASHRETKEGRKLSNATKGTLSDCHGHIKSAFDLLDALLSGEAGDESEDDSEEATSKTAAVSARKSEPEDLHSAAESIESMMALLRA